MNQEIKIQVGIVEDNNSLREGLVLYLDMQEELSCCISASSVESFFSKMKNTDAVVPDILLLDINLPGIDGTEGLPQMKQQFPAMNVIMLTINNESDYIFKAMCNGAIGYVLKGVPLAKIKESILDVHQGGSAISPIIARKMVAYFQPKKQDAGNSLTEKEKQVVECLVDGLSYKLCADRLNVTLETIRFHIKNIYRKLHVNSKSEVVKKSLKGEIKH
ncbi:MAG: two component transcriptional regulator, LuxR family [Bacteroidota bacterium]|nr:two component transcriptional regulator, LuxR family [Bacteroidota bacterium]